MENTGIVFCWILAAYLVGGIPFGFLIGKMRGVDVRTVGSKNIGATNVFRTVGKKWGVLAFACDVLKGLIPTLLAKQWALDPELPPDGSWFPLVVGVMCVVGHMLTPYMKFRGGKGVATAFGMLLGLAPALVGPGDQEQERGQDAEPEQHGDQKGSASFHIVTPSIEK